MEQTQPRLAATSQMKNSLLESLPHPVPVASGILPVPGWQLSQGGFLSAFNGKQL